MTTTTTRAGLFVQAGRALFGDAWQSATADALALDLRRVQRIAAAARDGAEYPIAPGLMTELAQLLRARAVACTSTADEISCGETGYPDA